MALTRRLSFTFDSQRLPDSALCTITCNDVPGTDVVQGLIASVFHNSNNSVINLPESADEYE